ncbi:hypothetical protein ACQPW3_13935 [Actinosynnema sp. CA-248983]
MFWLFAQMFVLCGFAFLAGAVLTWLPLRATIRKLRAELSHPAATRPALPAGTVVIPTQPTPALDAEPVERREEVAAEQEATPEATPEPAPVAASEAATGAAPEAEVSGAQQPGTQQPGTLQPGTLQPGTLQPGTLQRGVQQRGVQQRGVQQRGTQQPGAQQRGTQQPGTATFGAAAFEAEAAESVAAEVAVEVKGSSKSMIFHTPESPYFKRMKGDVTFRSIAEAEEAGYTRWRPKTAAVQAR